MPESTSATGPQFEIPAIGIVDLFHMLAIHRSDFVVLKMDVEGFEFDLLRHMVTHGLQTRVDILAVEYHDQNYHVFGKNEEIKRKYQSQHQCLDWILSDLPDMRTFDCGR